MMALLKEAYGILTPTERRQFWLVLLFSIIVAVFEVIGTLSIMPFLAVLADPNSIEGNRALFWAYNRFGFTDTQTFLFSLGLASFAFLLISAVMRAVGQYIVFRFSQLRGYSISKRLMETYLRQPYAYYVSHHTGEMSHKLLAETVTLTSQVYQPLTQLIAQLVIAVALVVLLVVVNPAVALTALAVLGSCYVLIYLATQGVLSRIGQWRMAANKARFRVAAETFGGAKTLKLLGRERANLVRFGIAAKQFARLQAKAMTLGEVPRFGIEAIAFGGIILLALVLLSQHGGSSGGAAGQLLPLLGLYAFVGYRLMPTLQKIYHAMTQLRTGTAAIDAIAKDLAGREDLPELPERPATPLPFKSEVALRGVTFCHDGAEAPSLRDITVTLPKGGTLGVVGSTGAGKTTLMDVFLGLLTPQTGDIRVDGTPVTPETLRAWQAGIGYVPQDIFLVDGTVAENIAFGLDLEGIDRARVEACAQMAQLADFVTGNLPDDYDTMVGERGVRLSGGQRQRVGIARALYHDPDILVFDEATSALDTVTEKAVVETISALSGTKTMMIVAHRISTIRDCDQIAVLDRGQIVALGSYQELVETSQEFAALIDTRGESPAVRLASEMRAQ
ncbi:MAG: ABC transporter ATP-binding protein [Pseudomonadota bacterium]